MLKIYSVLCAPVIPSPV